jgi:hypothetical protein
MSPTPTAQDPAVRSRRRQQRFPISLPVKYIVENVAGEGVTCDIGSDDLLIRTKCVLPKGRHIELSLDWPATFDGILPLRLDIEGKIRWSNVRGTAVAISRYKFRLGPVKISRKQTAGMSTG